MHLGNALVFLQGKNGLEEESDFRTRFGLLLKPPANIGFGVAQPGFPHAIRHVAGIARILFEIYRAVQSGLKLDRKRVVEGVGKENKELPFDLLPEKIVISRVAERVGFVFEILLASVFIKRVDQKFLLSHVGAQY
jgi:hypothetical protein